MPDPEAAVPVLTVDQQLVLTNKGVVEKGLGCGDVPQSLVSGGTQ